MEIQQTHTATNAITDIEQDTFETRRGAIDLVATMRVKAVLVALYGSYLSKESEINLLTHLREKHIAFIREQVHAMEDVCAYCLGSPPKTFTFPKDVLDWIHKLAKENQDTVGKMVLMTQLCRSILEHSEANSEKLLDTLAEQYEVGDRGYIESITDFCNQLWESLDEERIEATKKASQATDAVCEMLSRLDYIGRHVRLVSLNASVEAARAGEAGRGLAVIATEFKTLAEEIQTLAHGARKQIETI